MSNLNKKDFAKLCEMTTSELSVYIKRKKVIVQRNGYIDTKNEVNKLFIAKKNAVEVKEKPEKQQKKGAKVEENEGEGGELLGIERKRKQAELEKLRIETRISLLKEEKLKGGTIPIDIVKMIIANLSKSFINEFKNGSDDLIRVLTKEKNFSHKEISDLRGNLSNIINNSMKRGIENSKKEMKAVADNYSETRGVGEHD